ncbi:hypothetical protein CF326_g4876 [Tilletia indica]|nr:hypothetical protein CF326_g4876 [Tilletia indica]
MASLKLEAVTADGVYNSLEEWKHAVRFYALQHNFNPTWECSKSTWAVAVCEHKKSSGCSFRVRAHVDKDDSGIVRVSTFEEGHACAGKPPSQRKAYADHSFLVLIIQSCMSIDYKTTDAQVASQLKQTYGITLKQNTINKARNAIIGSAKLAQQEQFQYIQAWLTRLREKDPGAVVDHVATNGAFERAFLCPGPARMAWAHCKPFVAVDGTFTKNKFNMVLLLAATMDADSNLIILAWALVPSETQDTWDWFLRKLLIALPTLALPSSTIISDRQKGLLAAVREVLPATTEGYCCWHLAENVKKHYGQEARRLFWPLVYAANKSKFDSCMQALRQSSPGAAEYLADTAIAHKFWASYAFPGRRFDHVTSNLSEIANSALRQHRELAPLQMLSGIYAHEMTKFFERAQAAAAWKQTLAPHPHELLLTAIELARRMNVAPASVNTGLVTGSTGKTYEVTLATGPNKGLSSCTCGYPNLMLLPCGHLCCLALGLGQDATAYAWQYWQTVHWRATYQKPYVPVSCENLESNDIGAPAAANKRGRPTKKRMEAGRGKGKTKVSLCYDISELRPDKKCFDCFILATGIPLYLLLCLLLQRADLVLVPHAANLASVRQLGCYNLVFFGAAFAERPAPWNLPI